MSRKGENVGRDLRLHIYRHTLHPTKHAFGYKNNCEELARALVFHHIPNPLGNIFPAEAFHFPDARRARHVDFGHVVADHVDAGEDEAAFFEFWADGFADFVFALGEGRRCRRSTHMHVGAVFAVGGDAVDGAGHFTIDQNDAFVACTHLRQIGLRDEGFLEHLGEEFEQG